jgi:hypothetical protein
MKGQFMNGLFSDKGQINLVKNTAKDSKTITAFPSADSM